TVFLIRLPANCATFFPAPVLPVKVTAFTKGWAITFSICSPEISNILQQSVGKPASLTISEIANAQPLTLDACFNKPQFPAIKAGATNLKTCQNGKFQGIMAKTTPIGSWAI